MDPQSLLPAPHDRVSVGPQFGQPEMSPGFKMRTETLGDLPSDTKTGKTWAQDVSVWVA